MVKFIIFFQFKLLGQLLIYHDIRAGGLSLILVFTLPPIKKVENPMSCVGHLLVSIIVFNVNWCIQ